MLNPSLSIPELLATICDDLDSNRIAFYGQSLGAVYGTVITSYSIHYTKLYDR